MRPMPGGRWHSDVSGFDPALIVGQICAMQSLLYIALGAWFLLFNGLSGCPATSIGLEALFSACSLRLDKRGGWISLSAFSINSLSGGCLLSIIVERAKKCLDFTATAHMLHLCGCTLYDGFPKRWEWWLVTVMSMVVMSLFGEYLCMRRELRDIPIFTAGRQV